MIREEWTLIMKLKNNLYTQTGWEIEEYQFDPEQVVTTGSNFMIGNGYLGYRGTFSEWGKDKYVGCIVTDTYDMADGKWRELCNAPNGLYTKLLVEGEEVDFKQGTVDEYLRRIDFKTGIYEREFRWKGQSRSSSPIKVKTQRFASYDNLHLLPMKYSFKVEEATAITLITGIDGDVWSINGEHFDSYQLKELDNLIAVETVTTEQGIKLDVVEGLKIKGVKPSKEEVITGDESLLRRLEFDLTAGDIVTLEKIVAIYSSNDIKEPMLAAVNDVKEGLERGYNSLKSLHTRRWEEIWDMSDIVIEGDLEAQVALRFNLYHNIISTPAHSDRLPIGARGLSCQAYQGAAFWDQEIFNMPMFLYTRPEIARNILTYRYHTLDGARGKAEKMGYKGAFYAWISGKTGEELCPSYFFKDVISGRKIHNHFNSWQIHISPDVAYAVWHYYLATGDWEFIQEYGAEIIFEVCRFLYSHAYFKKDKNRFEFIRLLGPDEYHENVDNNAFTNYQARYCLDKAITIYEEMKEEQPDLLEKLMDKINLTDEEIENWREMEELIYLPQPDENGLIEQFDGYFDLEDTTPDVLEDRLLDPGEYWGWPNGVSVETQVIKQADVIQLFCLQDIFDKDIMRANYDYYEPRTQHGSSLSPSAYAMIATKVGYIEEAYSNFMKSCTVDLYNTNKAVSGGTFIGGIHTAACGAAWQMIVKGFAGLEIQSDYISFNPTLPAEWDSVSFKFVYQNQRFTVEMNRYQFIIKASSDNEQKIDFKVKGNRFTLESGEMNKL